MGATNLVDPLRKERWKEEPSDTWRVRSRNLQCRKGLEIAHGTSVSKKGCGGETERRGDESKSEVSRRVH